MAVSDQLEEEEKAVKATIARRSSNPKLERDDVDRLGTTRASKFDQARLSQVFPLPSFLHLVFLPLPLMLLLS